MSEDLVIRGTTYPYPTAGQEPGWGQPGSDWAQAVTDVLNDLQGVNDIPQTTLNLGNNVSIASILQNFEFNPVEVRSAVIDYTVYRLGSTDFSPTDVTPGTDTIAMAGHTLTNGQPLRFTTTNTLPAGLAVGTIYWVVGVVAVTSFQVSATFGGSPVNITSQGTGTHTAVLELAERGELSLIYKNGAPAGTKWGMNRASTGDDVGVTFTISDLGQVSYTSSNLNGTSYTGNVVFKALSLLQA